MTRDLLTDWLIWLWFDPIGILVYGTAMVAAGMLVLWRMGQAARARRRRYRLAMRARRA